MANRSGRSHSGPQPAQLSQLLVSGLGAIVAMSGVWLWFLSERSGRLAGLDDPFVAHRWIGRIHWVAAIVLGVVIGFMALRAISEAQGWSFVFLALFMFLLVIGFVTGYQTDWDAARLWASTVGSKFGTGLQLGDGPALPRSLREVRVHLSIVPAALLAVTVGSFWRYRRS